MMLVLVAACGRVGLDTGRKMDAGGASDAGDARMVDAPIDAAFRVLVGDTRSEQCADGHNAGLAEASSFVATSTGKVSTLSIDYVGGTTSQLVLALYDDDSANFMPRTLLATATLSGGGVIGAGVHDVPTDLQPTVVQGTRYWISVFCVGAGTSCNVRYTYTPGQSASTCTTTGAPCSSTTPACTVHSNSGSLVVPEPTWTLGGAVFGLSVNSYWASGT
jgi:hypothetical protein